MVSVALECVVVAVPLEPLALGHGDAVDEDPDAALGDDVTDAVADLDADDEVRALESKGGKDVDNGVGQPGDNSGVLGPVAREQEVGSAKEKR